MKQMILAAAMSLAAALGAFQVDSFAPQSGVPFSAQNGGKLVAVEVFAPEDGTVALSSVYAADVYTNAVEVNARTETEVTAVFSNTVTHAVTTNIFDSPKIHVPVWNVLVSSNIVESVVATTNEWPVYEKTVALTNAIISGASTSTNTYSGAPDGNVYIAPGEILIFNGTATGGFLRLILE